MKKSEKAEFDYVVDVHLELALEDIGPIKPWFDPDFQDWVFEHKLYPVEYGGKTKKEVIKNYPLHLREFIAQRLKGNLSPFTEARTRGRGGKRPGAGRPTGSTKEPTVVIRIPVEIANWIKSDPAHLEQLRSLINS